MSLIWSYILQEVMKCSSVSTSFCGQCAHSLANISYILCQSQWSGILPLCTLCLGSNSILVCSVFLLIKNSLFCFLVIWLGLIVLLSWGSVGCVCFL